MFGPIDGDNVPFEFENFNKGNASYLFKEFSKTWLLDGDILRCKKCNRGIHVSRMIEDFQHHPDCDNNKENRNPWYYLFCLLKSAVKITT